MFFSLVQDFGDVLNALPRKYPRYRILKLLDEAIRRDVHFVDRHPTTLFQCLWNTCWWYDCPDATRHYEPNLNEGLPDELSSRPLLYVLADAWLEKKLTDTPGFSWLRALRPPVVRLDSPQRSVIRAHRGAVTGVSISLDGRLLASTSGDTVGKGDRKARTWSISGGVERACFDKHRDGLTCVAFLPDSNFIASGSRDNTVRVWDSGSGEEIHCLRGHGDLIRCISVAPDGRLASGSWDRTIRIWDGTSGSLIQCLGPHSGGVTCLAFTSDGQRLISGSSKDSLAHLWDIASGQQIAVFQGHEGFDHRGHLVGLALTACGTRLITGAVDRTVRIWNVESQRQLVCIRTGTLPVDCVAVSPKGDVVASGGWDKNVRLWKAATGEEIACFAGHEDFVTSLAFGPSGHWLLSGSNDGTIRIWDCTPQSYAAKLRDHDEPINCIAFSPDGNHIASGSGSKLYDERDCSLRIWNTITGILIHRLAGHESELHTVAFSGNGRLVASASGRVQYASERREVDRSVRVWDVDSGKELACFRDLKASVRCVRFSPNDRLVAAASIDWIHLWNIGDQSEIACLENPFLRFQPGVSLYELEIARLTFSNDGRAITVESVGGRMWTFQLQNGAWQEFVLVETKLAEELAYIPKCTYRVINGSDPAIVSVDSGEVISWYPETIKHLAAHEQVRIWAGTLSNHLSIMKMDGSIER